MHAGWVASKQDRQALPLLLHSDEREGMLKRATRLQRGGAGRPRACALARYKGMCKAREPPWLSSPSGGRPRGSTTLTPSRRTRRCRWGALRLLLLLLLLGLLLCGSCRLCH